MSISAIGGGASTISSLLQATKSKNPALQNDPTTDTSQTSSTDSSSQSNTVVDQFLDYMKKSPMQRMIDQWLKAHGLTEQSLAALPPAKHDAIMKEMTQDIKNQIKRQEEAKATSAQTNILV